MIEFHGRGVLLDIEGTTSSVRFVYDVMFPYARREVEAYLRRHWSEPATVAACHRIAQDAGAASLEHWQPGQPPDRLQQAVLREVLRLMDADAKTTGLKELQGLVWRRGFESGELLAHVYDDVPPALQRWRAAGLEVCIYSSGSVTAQQLFFGHTVHGNLLPLFQAHFDTTTGPKKDPSSYLAIARQRQLDPADIVFFSDVLAEVQAAREAGLTALLCLRPGNAQTPAGHGFTEIHSFAEVNCFLRKN